MLTTKKVSKVYGTPILGMNETVKIDLSIFRINALLLNSVIERDLLVKDDDKSLHCKKLVYK